MPQVPRDLELLVDALGSLLEELPEDVGLAGELVTLGGSDTTPRKDAIQTSQLLGGPVVAVVQLGEHLDVVLGVLVLGVLGKGGSRSFDLLGGLGEGGAAGEPGDDGIQGGDGAGNGIETTTNGTAGAGPLVNPVKERLLGAAAAVDLGLGGALGEPLDSRVRGDALGGGGALAVLGLGIDLSDQNVVIQDEVLGNALPNRGEALAIC